MSLQQIDQMFIPEAADELQAWVKATFVTDECAAVHLAAVLILLSPSVEDAVGLLYDMADIEKAKEEFGHGS